MTKYKPTLSSVASVNLIPAAKLLYQFRHPDVQVVSGFDDETDFCTWSANAHSITVNLVLLGKHTYFLSFSKREATLHLSRGKIDAQQMRRVAIALNAVADLTERMRVV